jgi:hypothetical protein
MSVDPIADFWAPAATLVPIASIPYMIAVHDAFKRGSRARDKMWWVFWAGSVVIGLAFLAAEWICISKMQRVIPPEDVFVASLVAGLFLGAFAFTLLGPLALLPRAKAREEKE